MRHLIISREVPPASYAAGGIGTYVANIARLLAEKGDIVHLIGERWSGAHNTREELHDGRLIIHRISAHEVPVAPTPGDEDRMRRELQGLHDTAFPSQWFSWSAALVAEQIVREEGIDVIEAEEWEAALYYFLLRRSLGLGPERRPPCIVHLHSPSAFIYHYNGVAVPQGLPLMKRMEAFCVRSADALLCPSRRLAADATKYFGLAPDAIRTMPYPVGFAPALERDASTWRDGSICFVGRIEGRKGVIEWVEAAIRVAHENPHVHFDFVGSDIHRMQGALVEQIGEALAPRFRFHGPKLRTELPDFLGRATAGVVPSRWDNFPNVCIEAMASGLPVIATPFGGMAEMVEDGRTGWLADDRGVAGMVDSLADALRRCLATPPEQRAQMGAAASSEVRRICDNDKTVAASQQFRQAVAKAGAVRSDVARPATAPLPQAHVVLRVESVDEASATLRSLAEQTLPPAAVVVVHRRAADPHHLDPKLFGPGSRTVLHHAPQSVGTEAWNQGFAHLAGHGPAGFWMFLDQRDILEPDCLDKMAGVFASRPDVGVVSPWVSRTGHVHRLDMRPSPELAWQITGNDVAPASGFSAAALAGQSPFPPGLPREHDVWALSNRLIAGGWGAVTLPFLLAHRWTEPDQTNWLKATAEPAIRAEALAPFDSEGVRLALEIMDAQAPPTPADAPAAAHDKPLRRRALRAIERVVLNPRAVLRRWRTAMPRLFLRGAAKP